MRVIDLKSFKGLSVGRSAEGSAGNEVLAAKQRFAARVAQWKVLRNTILRAMRGVPSPGMGSTEGHLQNLVGDLVRGTSVKAPMLHVPDSTKSTKRWSVYRGPGAFTEAACTGSPITS